MASLPPERIVLREERFLLFEADASQRAALLERLAVEPATFAAAVLEGGSLTLLLPERTARRFGDLLRAARPERGAFGVLTFDLDFDWDVVGFLASVTARLAEAGIPAGALAAARRDHVFVPERDAEKALAVLRAAAAEGKISFATIGGGGA